MGGSSETKRGGGELAIRNEESAAVKGGDIEGREMSDGEGWT